MVKILGSAAAAGLMVLALGANSASATPILISNPGFESPAQSTSGAYTTNVVGSWTGVGTGTPQYGVYYVPPANYPGVSNGISGLPTPEGNQAAFIDGTGSLTQILAQTFQDFTTYTLQVYIGNRGDANYPSSGATIALYAGATQVAVSPSITPTDGHWQNITLTYITTNGAGDPFLNTAITIKLADVGNDSSQQVNFDNVRLDAVTTAPNGGGTGVPEPFTLSIFGAGLAGAAALRRRRKA